MARWAGTLALALSGLALAAAAGGYGLYGLKTCSRPLPCGASLVALLLGLIFTLAALSVLGDAMEELERESLLADVEDIEVMREWLDDAY